MAKKRNRTSVRAESSSIPTAVPVAVPVAMPAPIPWNSPEARVALDRETEQLWAHWALAAEFAPHIEDAPVMVLLLEAVREARRLGDAKALGMLDAGARAALDQVAPAIAAEAHARYLAEGTLAPGVTVEDLMPVRLSRRGAGRRGEVSAAAAWLAEHLDRYLTRASRRSSSSGAALPPMTAEEMSRGFVHSFAPHAGPIGRELKRLGLLPIHQAESYDRNGLRAGSDLDAKVKAVTAAFTKQLEKTPRTNGERRWVLDGTSLGTYSSGEDLTRVGLRALGLPREQVKHLYDAADKRTSRAS